MLKEHLRVRKKGIFPVVLLRWASSPSSAFPVKVLTATGMRPGPHRHAPDRTACKGPFAAVLVVSRVGCVPGEVSFEVKQKKATHTFSVVMKEAHMKISKEGTETRIQTGEASETLLCQEGPGRPCSSGLQHCPHPPPRGIPARRPRTIQEHFRQPSQ